jgi:uncharacterized protein YjlB
LRSGLSRGADGVGHLRATRSEGLRSAGGGVPRGLVLHLRIELGYPAAGTECTAVEDRSHALKTIPKVPVPRKDPAYGTAGPLAKLWRKPK